MTKAVLLYKTYADSRDVTRIAQGVDVPETVLSMRYISLGTHDDLLEIIDVVWNVRDCLYEMTVIPAGIPLSKEKILSMADTCCGPKGGVSCTD